MSQIRFNKPDDCAKAASADENETPILSLSVLLWVALLVALVFLASTPHITLPDLGIDPSAWAFFSA